MTNELKIKCRTSQQTQDGFTLDIKLENVFAQMSTYNKTDESGNIVNLVIFDLKSSDMFELAEQISNLANGIIENEIIEAGAIPNVPENREDLKIN